MNITETLSSPQLNTKSENRTQFSKKRTFIFFGILAVFFVLQHFLFTGFGKYSLDHIDLTSQHYRFPEYFRQLFYSTGELFPDYAANLGGGQNIYNFSYYGLYNPIILFSYLLPFVPMKLYIRITAYLSIYVGSMLLYKWLSSRFSQKICEYSTVLFVLATPLLFHTHRHTMFINYIPFVILALIGVDRFFEKGKSTLLSFAVCLICLTSYFYSIGSALAITLYGIYRYLELYPSKGFKSFMKKAVSFAIPVIIGVAMASLLLVPTFIALLSGRGESGSVITLKQILIPTLNANTIIYSAYSPGLGAFTLLALIFCMIKKRGSLRFLSVALILPCIFPLLLYILNATMYIDAKVLIPFIPLYIFIIAVTFNSMIKREEFGKWVFIIFALLVGFSALYDLKYTILIADALLILISFLLFKRFNKPLIIIIPCLTVSLIAFGTAQYTNEKHDADTMPQDEVSRSIVASLTEDDTDLFRISDKTKRLEIANRVLGEDHYISSVYSSLSNQNYTSFYYDRIGNEVIHRSKGQLSNTDNLLFDLYMGNKYILHDDLKTNGYTKISDNNGVNVYKNDAALPIAYHTDRLMSLKQFEELEYPYSAEVLLNYVICEDAPYNTEYTTAIKEIEMPEYDIVSSEGLTIQKTDNGYTVTSNQGGNIRLILKSPIKDSLFFVHFDLKNQNSRSYGDNTIKINGMINKRPYKGWKYDNRNTSFEYTFSDKVISSFDINIDKGTYVLENFDFYLADYNEFVKNTSSVTPLEFDRNKCNGDILEGEITVTENGYLHFSIPYDKGYTLFIDGKETEYEMTDTAFIGTAIEKGTHSIRLEYEAPGAYAGRLISLAALGSAILLFILERSRKKAKVL